MPEATKGRTGRISGLQRSDGGVPKLSVEHARVTVGGLEGDRQRHLDFHGGPTRALCLYSAELLDALVAEGHPVSPGALGENVTIRGLDWRRVIPGARLHLGGVETEVTGYAAPCRTIAHAFTDSYFPRVSQKLNPGWSRVYVRVVREGELMLGDEVSLADPDQLALLD